MAVTLETLALQIEVNHQDMVAGLNKAEKSVEKSTSKMTKHFKKLAAKLAIGATVFKVGKAYLAAADKMQQLDFRLKAVTGSMTSANIAMEYVISTANRQNVSIARMADAYTRLLPSVKSGALEMGEMRTIVELINDNMKAFGVTAGNAERLFFGLSQLLGSGVVTMENLKQVTEHLPGSLMDLASAMGTNLDGLIDMVSTGKVTAEMMKGPLTEALGKNTGAAESMGNTYDSAKVKLKNTFDEMARGSSILDVATLAINTQTEALKATNKVYLHLENIGRKRADLFHNLWKSRKEIEEEEKYFREAAERGNKVREKQAKIAEENLNREAEAQKKLNEAIAAKVALEEEQKKLKPKLEEIEERIMGEQQLIMHKYEKEKELLRQFEENKLEIKGGYIEAEKELRRQAGEELKEIDDKKNEERREAEAKLYGDLFAKQQEFSNKFKKLKELEGSQLIAGTIGTLMTVTSEAAKHNKKAFELHKALGIGQAVISTAAGITRAFQDFPFPVAAPIAAGIGALGAAQIATIASQQFQGGGSSGGGSGGTASISSAGSSTQSGGSQESTRGLNIGISGVDKDQSFSGQQVNELIKAINEEVENGAVIKGLSVV